MSRYFETSFGRKIEIVEGYRDLHIKQLPGEILLAGESSKPEKRQPLKYGGFVKDVFLYSCMVDLLRDKNIDLKVGKALDVGGGEGTMARLLRMEGRADHVHVIELYDMRGLLPDSLFNSHVSLMRRHVFLSGVGLARYDSVRKNSIFEATSHYPHAASAYYHLRKNGPGIIDEYTLRNYYDVEGKYDLLTAFSCVDYFNPELFFKKAGEILNDGGIFYAHLAYWWYPVNCSLVIGDFPYTSQRLNKADFSRYLREVRPDEYEDTMERYNYFHLGEHHPTVDQYVEYADKAGLSLIASQRLLGGRGKMSPFTPSELNEFSDAPLSMVLEDIHQFNPRVGMTDLYTFNALVAFRKRPTGQKTLAKTVTETHSRCLK